MKVYKTDGYIGKGQSIGIFSKISNNEPPHTHEFVEIIYVKSGSAIETIDGIDYPVKRGDIIFVNYKSVHSFVATNNENYEYINICFKPEVVANSIITPENAFPLLSLTAFNEMSKEIVGAKLSFLGVERQEIENVLDSMLREVKNGEQFSSRILESYMNVLITKMLRKTTSLSQQDDSDDMWDGLFDYIEENLNTKLTLSTLASKCFYNPSYFSRIFKEKHGVTLTEYVAKRRVKLAEKLLSESLFTVDEISAKAGFADRSSFYHFFSSFNGITPTEYRKTKLTSTKNQDK